jgi:hypothetical protein
MADYYEKKKLAYLGFQCLYHPPYSPDLAPSDDHLFPGLKKQQLKGHHFSTNTEVIAAAENWLNGQRSECFLSGLQNYSNGLRNISTNVGSVLNKSRAWSLWLVCVMVGLRTYQHPLLHNVYHLEDCRLSKHYMEVRTQPVSIRKTN